MMINQKNAQCYKKNTISKEDKNSPFYIGWLNQDQIKRGSTAPNIQLLIQKPEIKSQIHPQIQSSRRQIKKQTDQTKLNQISSNRNFKIVVKNERYFQSNTQRGDTQQAPQIQNQKIIQNKNQQNNIFKDDSIENVKDSVDNEEMNFNKNQKDKKDEKKQNKQNEISSNSLQNKQMKQIEILNSQNRPQTSLGVQIKFNNKSSIHRHQTVSENQSSELLQFLVKNRNAGKIEHIPNYTNKNHNQKSQTQFTQQDEIQQKTLSQNINQKSIPIIHNTKNYLNDLKNKKNTETNTSEQITAPYKIVINHNRSTSNNSNRISIKFETKLDANFINLFADQQI